MLFSATHSYLPSSDSRLCLICSDPVQAIIIVVVIIINIIIIIIILNKVKLASHEARLKGLKHKIAACCLTAMEIK